MKINVTENKVSIKEEQILNENEYNIHRIQFDFSSEYTDDLVKVALFSIDNHTYKKIISNNECDIPPEVLTQRGYSILGVYAYKTEQDSLVLRYSPSPTKISVYDGSYKADAENSEPITPSEIEQYQQILQNSLQQFQNQYNALVEETEGDIQAIEDELQRKVDEGYFDGEDGFSPIAKVIQKSNGATIEIEDKNGKTTADVLNGEDGYTPVRGVDYWTEEDKQEVEEEATQQIEGKIEEYNENAAEKLNQYNQNSVQKTNDYNTNAEQKMSAYNTNATEKTSTYNSNATEKFNDYNSNAEQKETNYNTNASQKVESFNINASSKLSEYNSNAETKKSAYDENATQKTNSFNTNATNKLTEYNTNHTEKMSAYNSNSTQKLNAFNENATQKTEDFDEHTEEIQDNIEILQRTDNQILSRFNKDEEVSGQDITLTGTTEIKFAKPPLPMGNSEQVQYSGKNLFNAEENLTFSGVKTINVSIPAGTYRLTFESQSHQGEQNPYIRFDEANIGMDFDRTLDREIILNTDVSTVYLYSNGYNYVESQGISATINKLMVSVAGGDYEPYVGGTASPNPDYPQEISNVTGDVEVKVQNKNWLPNNVVNQTKNGITITKNNDGTITANGTATVQTEILISSVKLSAGNYLGSIGVKGSMAYYYVRLGEGTTSRSPFIANIGTGDNAFTLDETKIIGAILIIKSGKTLNNVIFKPMIRLASITDNSYVPHKEQTFTFPLGNEKLMLGDYLADDGIHHVRGQVVLDGSDDEDWSISSIAPQEYTKRFVFATLTNKAKANFENTPKCNYFTENIYPNVDQENIYYVFAPDATYMAFRIGINKATTLQEFKNWLSTHNIVVEYDLMEEVIVPYTSVQQRVYNEIKNAYSYDEMTIITGSSDGNKPFFIVQAYKDLNKELNNKVDKVQGKELSSNDFTDTLKEKLEGLENYDDTEIKADISGKQNITDNTLTTINKTVPTAINEVNSIAKLANQAKSYSTYQAFINYLNTAEKTEFIPGQSFMIQTKLVPDLWVYSVENTSVQYTYTTDEDFITYTNQATGGQVGYYKLAQLETQKVDLTNYVTFDDYATSTTAGVVKTNSMYGVSTSSYTQNITATTKTYDQYQSSNNATFVGKGTLENVITGKNLESANNKTTTISSSSTDNEYPSAKAVYDYIQSILNN